jgi:hypothetical protein
MTMNSQFLTLALGASCMALILWVWRLRNSNAILKAKVNALNMQLEDAIQRLGKYENEPKSKTFAKIIDLLAAAGVPA